MSLTTEQDGDSSGDGGWLCLDFANTIGSRVNEDSVDKLAGYQELVAWSIEKGALTPDDAERLNQEAFQRPAEAEVVFHRAIDLREAIYRIFAAAADGRPPRMGDLPILNAAIALAQTRRQLVYTPAGFQWVWIPEQDRLDPMLWPVALSAGELLTSARLSRVKECANDTCSWLFVDMSRNRSRRWCDMSDCGNRAKARRHYHRQHDAQSSGDGEG